MNSDNIIKQYLRDFFKALNVRVADSYKVCIENMHIHETAAPINFDLSLSFDLLVHLTRLDPKSFPEPTHCIDFSDSKQNTWGNDIHILTLICEGLIDRVCVFNKDNGNMKLRSYFVLEDVDEKSPDLRTMELFSTEDHFQIFSQISTFMREQIESFDNDFKERICLFPAIKQDDEKNQENVTEALFPHPVLFLK